MQEPFPLLVNADVTVSMESYVDSEGANSVLKRQRVLDIRTRCEWRGLDGPLNFGEIDEKFDAMTYFQFDELHRVGKEILNRLLVDKIKTEISLNATEST